MAQAQALGKGATVPPSPSASSLASIMSQCLSLEVSITSLLQTLNPRSADCPRPSPSPLDPFAPHLNPGLVIRVIKAQKNPLHALFFFNWASTSPNRYSHTNPCFVSITDLLLSHGLFSKAVSLLKSANKLSDFMISKLIKSRGDRNDIWGAIDCFNYVKSLESGRCLFSYNAILGVLVRANRIGLARGFFNQMLKEGVVAPDVSTFTTMIRGYCKNGRMGDARMVFDEMTCEPNLVTYNTIIAGFCSNGLMDDARGTVDGMIQRRVCLPDIVTYTTLIDGFCKAGDFAAAKSCMDEMVSRNQKPSMVTYNALINGLCLNGRVDEARMMMNRMWSDGLRSNVSTHTSLAIGLCIVGKSGEAIKHLWEMVRLGMELDAKSFRLVLKEYCKTDQPDMAIALLKVMKVKGINPNISCYNETLRSLVRFKELGRAVVFLKEMDGLCCSPNSLSYSIVVCGLCDAKGWMNEAREVVDDMLQKGYVMTTDMYGSLVRGYCEDGNEELAVEVFHEMIDNGYVIDLQSFEILVRKLCGKGTVLEVENFANKLYSMKCDGARMDSYRKVLNENLSKTRFWMYGFDEKG